MSPVHVALGDRSYDIVVEESYDALQELLRGRRRVALVTQTLVDDHVGGSSADALRRARGLSPLPTRPLHHGRGRRCQVARYSSRAAPPRLTRFGLLRGDVVVAMGGGVVGDTAAFVAAA